MSIQLNTNVTALTAQRILSRNTVVMEKSIEKLSTGFRINRAGDDSAGLSISEGLRSQIRGSQKALENVQDAMNLLTMVDEFFSRIVSYAQRIRELSVQASNDTNGPSQIQALYDEALQLRDQYFKDSNSFQYNGQYFFRNLSGAAAVNKPNFMVQAGPDSDANSRIDIGSVLNFYNTGGSSGFNEYFIVDAGLDPFNSFYGTLNQNNIISMDYAIGAVLRLRTKVGAFMNRLEGAASNLAVGIENYSAAEARIRNVDVSNETSKLVQSQVLQQAASSILVQANQKQSLVQMLLNL
jgi:flagellin